MYTLMHNGNTLFDPRLDGYPLQSPLITLESNKINTLDFTIYPGNPEYGQIEKIVSLLSVYRDDALYMQFRPVYKKELFRGGILYKCKEITFRLNDFRYRAYTYSGTIDGFVTAVLASYNARVNVDEQILKGNVSSASTSFEFDTDKPLGHWDALLAVVDDNGGYFSTRYHGGNVYMDYLQDADLPVSEQKIQFGENMTDLFIETDSDNTFSVLYPVGKNGEDRITIESVNGGRDYLESAAGIALYGRRETSIAWENVESASQLKSLAQAALDEIAVQFAESVSVSAVDLHNANADVSSLEFLSMVDCVSAPHGFSHRYVLGRISIPLGAPDSATAQLGESRKSLNDRITLEKRETEKAISAESSRAREEEKRLKTDITVVDGLIKAEVTRATEAENGKLDKTTQYQTPEQIVSEAIRVSGLTADEKYIAQTTQYKTVQSLLNDAQSKADAAAQSAKDASIAKTARYQTADAIVDVAVAVADADAANAYIARTSNYQTADAIVNEAVRAAGVDAASAYLAKSGSYTTVNDILQEAQNKADAAAVTAQNASIAKTASYQTADAIVNAAVAIAETDAGGTYIAKTATYQTADAIVAAAEAYTDDNAYKQVSGISITAAGVEVSGSKYVKINSGGSFQLNSDNLLINSTSGVIMANSNGTQAFYCGAGRTQIRALDIYSTYDNSYTDVTDAISKLDYYGWIRNASVSGNTLILTKDNGGTVQYTPSGGSGFTPSYGLQQLNDILQDATWSTQSGKLTLYLSGNYSISLAAGYHDAD